MDIHKPKAAHSIREFLIEIGTITTGILIALALESLVEARRDHQLVQHARTDLRQELTADRRALAVLVTEQQRLDASLDALIRYGRSKAAGHAAKAPEEAELVFNTPTLTTSAWESANGTQALVHMPYDEAHAIARAYTAVRTIAAVQDEARPHWIALTAFDQPDALSPAELGAWSNGVALGRTYQNALGRAAGRALPELDQALAQLR